MFSELIILITKASFQLSGIWKGLDEFNQGFVEALIHNLIMLKKVEIFLGRHHCKTESQTGPKVISIPPTEVKKNLLDFVIFSHSARITL